MTRSYVGELEIDTDRGVIYFHCSMENAVPTLLRICNLNLRGAEYERLVGKTLLDITHMHGAAFANTPVNPRILGTPPA